LTTKHTKHALSNVEGSTKEENIFFPDSMSSPLSRSGLRVLRDLRGEKGFRWI